MKQYTILPREDYDKKVSLRGKKFLCYSPDKMDEKYPKGDCPILGEIRNTKVKKNADLITIGRERYTVEEPGTYSKLLYRTVGYLSVSESGCIAVKKSRLPFLLILLGLLCGIGIALHILIGILRGPDIPVIAPSQPLPPADEYIESIEDDESQAPAANGGGSVSMIYSLDAKLTLSNNRIGILFKNPSVSNHDVVLELYIVSGTDRLQIAESGRIPAGSSLNRMDFDYQAVTLSEGLYTGLYKVIYYDPQTGQRALVESEITDVTITVQP